MNASQAPETGKPRIPIFIDGREYTSRASRMAEADLRHISQPPIDEDQQLYLDIPDAPDRFLEAGETIELSAGMRFFSEPPEITIHIDRTPYTVAKKRMTGLELRAVPTPPIAEDRDLWLDRIDQRDKKITDHEVVRLRDGMRFFTAPGRINPGTR